MPVIVTRIYDSEETAKQAAADVKQHTSPGQVVVVTPSDSGSAEAALAKTGMSAASAKAYAEAVGRGRSVVSVAPTFGYAAPVTAALDRAGPVDTHVTDVPEAPPAKTTWRKSTMTPRKTVDDPAAPLSSKFGWAVLSDDPAPASKKFGWPVLLDDPSPLSNKLGWRTLSASQGSRATLSNDPAPLSSRLGWPVLLNDASPASNRFGWPVLKDDPAPASTKFGWRTLSPSQSPSTSLINNPAPLSTFLGIPVLLNERKKTD